MKLRSSLVTLLALTAGCDTDPIDNSPKAPPSCAGKGGCITTVIGNGQNGMAVDGVPAWQTPTSLPQDGVIGPDGAFYFLDWNNHQVRRFDPKSGTTSNIAGTGEIGDNGSGGPAVAAKLNHPTALLFVPNTNKLLIAAWHNSKVKQVDLTTGVLTDVCGTGARAFGGDGGPAKAAKLDLPVGLAYDSKGNLLIADQANQRIRKVDPSDVITTVVGDRWVTDSGSKDGQPVQDAQGRYLDCTEMPIADKDKNSLILDQDGQFVVQTQDGKPVPYPGALPAPNVCAKFAGDGGPALQAYLGGSRAQSATPTSRIAVGKDDALYIADTLNHRIRRVDPVTGVIDTIAGSGTPGYDGDGKDAKAAQLNLPADVDVLPDGAVLIADTYNHCVRIVKGGKIDTFAGTCGKKGFGGDGADARKALLNRPWGLHVDQATGTVYIADTYNQRIRTVTK